MPRPSDYTNELADLICERIAEGNSLRSICSEDGMPHASTVCRWLAREDQAAFREQYARAREAQADTLFDQILQIADDGSNDTYEKDDGTELVNHDHIQRSRLRVDARKWMAGKLAPKKYGEKLALTDADGGPLTVNVVQRADPRSTS